MTPKYYSRRGRARNTACSRGAREGPARSVSRAAQETLRLWRAPFPPRRASVTIPRARSQPCRARRWILMKLDTMLSARDLHEVPQAAKAAEDAGFDAIWSMEAGNDGFLPLALAAE